MAVVIPQYHQLMWPVLEALKALGGSATVREIYERVVEDRKFTEAQQSIPTRDGRMSQIEYRLHWARTHLKGIGAIDNSARGVWAIMEKGRSIHPDQLQAEVKAWRGRLRTRRLDSETPDASPAEIEDEQAEQTWKDALIARLLKLPSSGFERLAQRILREAGFVNVTVTGKTGDGGIDGVGTYRLSLVSFPVYFQCKKYQGTVSASAVRDFRGAMAGRGEKGLLITTGSFTRDAQREAIRDGAPPVELIDGERLCNILKDYSLGVDVRQRIEEDITIDDSFFEEYT